MAEGATRELAPGLIHHPGYLDGPARARLVSELRAAMQAAPPYTPRMPKTGRPFSVRMTNAGPLGWVSDETGYRYQPSHPETGAPWPAMPPTALAAWRELAEFQGRPEACLINLYAPGTRMGLHQDRDEAEFDAPVVSLSLGASALFRYGGLKRSDPTRSIVLKSGDAIVMGGPSRLIFHGIDRLFEEKSDLLSSTPNGGNDLSPDFLSPLLGSGGRCNLTLRRVNPRETIPAA